jgi:hypothetical protein
MPYISREKREYFESAVRAINNSFEQLDEFAMPGDLAYIIWICIKNYLKLGRCYRTYTEVLGVLESLKLLLYEQEISSYEKTKKEENSDV